MKKTTLLICNLFIGLFLIFFGSYIQAQDIPVKVTGIRSPKGNIILNVFKDQAGYNGEEPFKKFTFDKKAMEDGTMTVRIDLESGIYGITLLDDENGNGKIDRSFIQVPKEGFGFSNFYMEKLKKPVFDDFKVDLRSHPIIGIRVKYM